MAKLSMMNDMATQQKTGLLSLVSMTLPYLTNKAAPAKLSSKF